MNIGQISFLKRLRAGELQDPVRDWLTVLTFSGIALAGIIVWNAWAFDTVASGGAIGASSLKSPPIFNHASLDAIHTIFTNRAIEEEKYKTGTYSYADPSQ